MPTDPLAPSPHNPLDPNDLILTDMQYFGEALGRNEDVGEKRLTLFLSLATVVAGGAGALAASDSERGQSAFKAMVLPALLLLFAFGILTYMRMLQRRRVQMQYHDTLEYLRQCYRSRCPDLAEYRVPTKPDNSLLSRCLRGGYIETMAIFNGILVGCLVMLTWQTGRGPAVASGLAAAFLLWQPARRKHEAGTKT